MAHEKEWKSRHDIIKEAQVALPEHVLVLDLSAAPAWEFLRNVERNVEYPRPLPRLGTHTHSS